MPRVITTICFTCCFYLCFAQTSFTEATDRLANKNINSGAPIGIADMNNDGLDDIVRFHRGHQLTIDLQTPSGDFEDLPSDVETFNLDWSMCIGDYDRNGYNDIFFGTSSNVSLLIAKADDTGSSYELTTLEGPQIFAQGANFVDIDSDGNLDLFACSDHSINSVYRNINNEMVYDPLLIYTGTVVPSNNSGNYASIWTDYDGDDDMDLYISKCSQGVLDQNDPRRINMLMENDGDNNFTEVAALRNILPYGQSWAADFADIDNDGDMDAFIINHDTTDRLYENDGTGHFTDITSSAGFSPAIDNLGLGIQVKFVDFDNDTYVDLLLTSSQGGYKYFRNNGDKTFSVIFGAFQTGTLKMHSMAIGDLNNDGFLDILAGFGVFFNGVTDFPDKLFLNNGNTNNWVKINLTGTESNVNAIGAKLELFGQWGKMTREIRSGEGYGIMNTLTGHFGIGTATSIDSLILKWPSGQTDVIVNPEINTTHNITEVFCPPVYTNFVETRCDSVPIEWNGITIDSSDTYTYVSTAESGCDSIVTLDIVFSSITEETNTIAACEGSSFIFPDGSSIVISNDFNHTSNFMNSVGCDSIVNTNVIMIPSVEATASEQVCQGSEFVFPDGSMQTILQDTFQTSILVAQNNCDSIVTTEVSIIPASVSESFFDICIGDLFILPDSTEITITQDVQFSEAIPSTVGCDSLNLINITALDNYNIILTDTACEGQSYTFPDGTIFDDLDETISHTSHFASVDNCDSTVLINLQVLPNAVAELYDTICNNTMYELPDGTTEQIVGNQVLQVSIPAVNSCDSMITLFLETRESYFFTLTENICSGEDYTFFDGTNISNITSDTTYLSSFLTFDGCDSIIATDLSVLPISTTDESFTICSGDSFTFPDGTMQSNILAPLVYTSEFTGSNLCDSTINTLLEVVENYNQSLDIEACENTILYGEDLFENIFSDTTIVIMNTSQDGCDSTLTLNVTLEIPDLATTFVDGTLTALGENSTYQWVDCANNFTPIENEINQTFEPTSSGQYAVLIDNGICLGQSECTEVIINSIAENELPDFSIYPNPAHNNLTIEFENNLETIDVSIIDIYGQIIFQSKQQSNKLEINTSEFGPAVYFIHLKSSSTEATTRIIKV